MSHKIEKYGPVFEAARGVQSYVSGITVYHTGSARRDTRTMLEVADAILPLLEKKHSCKYDREKVAAALKDRSHIFHGLKAQAETVTSPEGVVTDWFGYRTDSSSGSGLRENFIVI